MRGITESRRFSLMQAAGAMAEINRINYEGPRLTDHLKSLIQMRPAASGPGQN